MKDKQSKSVFIMRFNFGGLMRVCTNKIAHLIPSGEGISISNFQHTIISFLPLLRKQDIVKKLKNSAVFLCKN